VSDGSHSPLRLRAADAPRPEEVVLLAGSGDYPRLCARRMQALGIRLHLLALDEALDREFFGSFPFRSRRFLPIGHLGKILEALEEIGAPYALSAGQIQPGKLFHGLQPDDRAFGLLQQLKQRNAATIFGAIADAIEAGGTRLLDARSFMEEDLAGEGPRTSAPWQLPDPVLAHGIHIARAIAALDIGQGVVVHSGTVLCVEGFDGTDALLEHAGQFAIQPKLFVKSSGPRQDFRFDVPVFGLHTLQHLRRSGIGYVALEADRTLILNQKEVLARADAGGIRIFGYSAPPEADP